MKKIKVQFVKYDMTKTKNRKRREMLVDGKSEAAVRTQLERIHKGEKVVQIHEIIWDEDQIKEVQALMEQEDNEFFTGTVKWFETTKGFGFIQPDEEDMDDLFFHQSACKDGAPLANDRVEFKVSEGPKGLVATHVRIVEEN